MEFYIIDVQQSIILLRKPCTTWR